MHALKQEWANSYMLANKVSKQAFIHRFVKVSNTQTRGSGDGAEDLKDSYTAEEMGVPYQVSAKASEKIDNVFREYVTREFDCEVKSIQNDDWKIIAKELQDQSFKSNQFKLASRFAIQDALTKGAGFLRVKMYDLTANVLSPVIAKTGKKKITFKKIEKNIKRGVEIEYVDCENVYIDPEATNPKELFVSTCYKDLELINLFPIIKSKINFQNQTIDDKTKKSFISPQNIPYYKIGERLVEWYQHPEKKLSFQDRNIDYTLNASDNLYSDNLSAFNSNWDNNIFSLATDSSFNTYASTETQYGNVYRVNEYYNWADLENPRYVLYIDNYVLYDGAILEPFQDNPLVALYYERPKQSIFGRGIPSKIREELVKLNEASTDVSEMLKMSKANMIEVNEDRLVEPNVPIDIEPNSLTIVRTRSGTQDGAIANTPAVIPINIPISGLEINLQREQMYKADIESIMPNSEPIAVNMSKEEREQSIRSRTLIINEVLNINKIQLSQLAYRVFAMKMFELQYFGEPLGIKTESSNRLLIIRDTGKDLVLAKNEVTNRLKEQYQAQITVARGQLLKDPNFLKQLDQVKIQLQDKYTNLADSAKQDIKTAESNKIVDIAKVSYEKELNQYIDSVVSQQVQPLQDNNIYLAIEEIDDLLSAQKEFSFSFNKSREEQQIAMNQLLSFVGQLPLSGQALSYDAVVAEALVAYGMNPLIKLRDMPPTNQMMAKSQTRHTTFFGLDSSPKNGQAVLKDVYGIDLPEDTFINDMTTLEQLKQASQVGLNQDKAIVDAKVALSKEGFKKGLVSGGIS